MPVWARYLILGLLALASGCAEAPPPRSAWGPIVTLGQAQQSRAPALWASSDRAVAVWVGADEAGVHHDGRALAAEGLSPQVTLPLPPVHPYDQQLAPAGEANLHLLWLDAAPGGGHPRLYSALTAPSLEVIRGPVEVTAGPTWRYAVLPGLGGGLWAVSSGGQAAEPALFIHWIDAAGRPRQETAAPIITDADWPALAQTDDGAAYLFWRRPSDGGLLRARLTDGAPGPAVWLAAAALNPGDRLESLSAALDRTHGYLFWNVTRAGGERETWFTSGPLNADAWSPAARLGIESIPDAPFETSFNSGAALAAVPGAGWLRWVSPLAGQFETLPVAAQTGGGLALVYFRGGQVVASQQIVPGAALAGPPALRSDRDRYLYLAWAQPAASGAAALRLTTLKPLPAS